LGCLANGGLLKNAVLTHFARVNHRKWPNVLTTDHYFGVLDTGRMTSARLQNILRSLPDGVSEVTMHPSLPPQASGEESGVRAHDDLLACSRQDQRFLRRHRAAQELAALLDPAVRETLATQDLRLARFQDLAACRSAGSHCVAVSRRPSISSTTTESTASGA
jgi:hypothetical protein